MGVNLFDKLFKHSDKPGIETVNKESNSLVEQSELLLADAQIDLNEANSICLPISALTNLGNASICLSNGVCSLLSNAPVGEKVYRIANASVGDCLKTTKNGEFWGALKQADGSSKMAKFAEVNVAGTAAQINPALVMMTVALYSIEKQLDEIVETEKKIVTFLQENNEAEIESDLKTLTAIIQEYKYNWNSDKYVSSHHKLSLDIKRTAEKNILLYRKQISDVLKDKQIIVANKKVNSIEYDLQKKFKYYRLALYVFSFASFLEIMLLGNYQEDYIQQVQTKIKEYSEDYGTIYNRSSDYISQMANSAIETNVVRSIGTAEKALGNLLGNIPLVKGTSMNGWLNEKGDNLHVASTAMKQEATNRFDVISDSGIQIFVDKFETINTIFNHSKDVCFDRNNIYLIVEK